MYSILEKRYIHHIKCTKNVTKCICFVTNFVHKDINNRKTQIKSKCLIHSNIVYLFFLINENHRKGTTFPPLRFQ